MQQSQRGDWSAAAGSVSSTDEDWRVALSLAPVMLVLLLLGRSILLYTLAVGCCAAWLLEVFAQPPALALGTFWLTMLAAQLVVVVNAAPLLLADSIFNVLMLFMFGLGVFLIAAWGSLRLSPIDWASRPQFRLIQKVLRRAVRGVSPIVGAVVLAWALARFWVSSAPWFALVGLLFNCWLYDSGSGQYIEHLLLRTACVIFPPLLHLAMHWRRGLAYGDVWLEALPLFALPVLLLRESRGPPSHDNGGSLVSRERTAAAVLLILWVVYRLLVSPSIFVVLPLGRQLPWVFVAVFIVAVTSSICGAVATFAGAVGSPDESSTTSSRISTFASVCSICSGLSWGLLCAQPALLVCLPTAFWFLFRFFRRPSFQTFFVIIASLAVGLLVLLHRLVGHLDFSFRINGYSVQAVTYSVGLLALGWLSLLGQQAIFLRRYAPLSGRLDGPRGPLAVAAGGALLVALACGQAAVEHVLLAENNASWTTASSFFFPPWTVLLTSLLAAAVAVRLFRSSAISSLAAATAVAVSVGKCALLMSATVPWAPLRVTLLALSLWPLCSSSTVGVEPPSEALYSSAGVAIALLACSPLLGDEIPAALGLPVAFVQVGGAAMLWGFCSLPLRSAFRGPGRLFSHFILLATFGPVLVALIWTSVGATRSSFGVLVPAVALVGGAWRVLRPRTFSARCIFGAVAAAWFAFLIVFVLLPPASIVWSTAFGCLAVALALQLVCADQAKPTAIPFLLIIQAAIGLALLVGAAVAVSPTSAPRFRLENVSQLRQAVILTMAFGNLALSLMVKLRLVPPDRERTMSGAEAVQQLLLRCGNASTLVFVHLGVAIHFVYLKGSVLGLVILSPLLLLLSAPRRRQRPLWQNPYFPVCAWLFAILSVTATAALFGSFAPAASKALLRTWLHGDLLKDADLVWFLKNAVLLGVSTPAHVLFCRYLLNEQPQTGRLWAAAPINVLPLLLADISSIQLLGLLSLAYSAAGGVLLSRLKIRSAAVL